MTPLTFVFATVASLAVVSCSSSSLDCRPDAAHERPNGRAAYGSLTRVSRLERFKTEMEGSSLECKPNEVCIKLEEEASRGSLQDAPRAPRHKRSTLASRKALASQQGDDVVLLSERPMTRAYARKIKAHEERPAVQKASETLNILEPSVDESINIRNNCVGDSPSDLPDLRSTRPIDLWMVKEYAFFVIGFILFQVISHSGFLEELPGQPTVRLIAAKIVFSIVLGKFAAMVMEIGGAILG